MDVGLYGCGTLQINCKHFPQQLKPYMKKGLPSRGDFMMTQSGNLTVGLWQDNRPVTVISTNSDPREVKSVERKMEDGTKKTVECPIYVMNYNNYMGGVDINDQLCLKMKMERHETIWHCETCQIHLRHNGKDDDCFLMYHKRATQSS